MEKIDEDLMDEFDSPTSTSNYLFPEVSTSKIKPLPIFPSVPTSKINYKKNIGSDSDIFYRDFIKPMEEDYKKAKKRNDLETEIKLGSEIISRNKTLKKIKEREEEERMRERLRQLKRGGRTRKYNYKYKYGHKYGHKTRKTRKMRRKYRNKKK